MIVGRRRPKRWISKATPTSPATSTSTPTTVAARVERGEQRARRAAPKRQAHGERRRAIDAREVPGERRATISVLRIRSPSGLMLASIDSPQGDQRERIAATAASEHPERDDAPVSTGGHCSRPGGTARPSGGMPWASSGNDVETRVAGLDARRRGDRGRRAARARTSALARILAPSLRRPLRSSRPASSSALCSSDDTCDHSLAAPSPTTSPEGRRRARRTARRERRSALHASLDITVITSGGASRWMLATLSSVGTLRHAHQARVAGDLERSAVAEHVPEVQARTAAARQEREQREVRHPGDRDAHARPGRG